MPAELAHFFFRTQHLLAAVFDRFLPRKFRLDGNLDFLRAVVPRFLRPGLTMYDVGGGKNPVLSPSRKAELGIRVTGLDISRNELDQAPTGAYDETIVGDVSTFRGRADGDLLVCQALLEHVPDVGKAFSGLSSILKPGGVALIFVPSRNALYARLNLVLPETLKRALLFWIHPKAMRDQGFPSYYDRCTPVGFERLCRRNGLTVIEKKLYFLSSYFSFFLPLHAAWRCYVLARHQLLGADAAAETFVLVLRKST